MAVSAWSPIPASVPSDPSDQEPSATATEPEALPSMSDLEALSLELDQIDTALTRMDFEPHSAQATSVPADAAATGAQPPWPRENPEPAR